MYLCNDRISLKVEQEQRNSALIRSYDYSLLYTPFIDVSRLIG